MQTCTSLKDVTQDASRAHECYAGCRALLIALGDTLRKEISGMVTEIPTPPPAAQARQFPADAPTMGRAITIDRPAEELQQLWHRPDTVPRVMGHVAEVTAAGDGQPQAVLE